MKAKEVIETVLEIIRGQMTITVEKPVYEYRLIEPDNRDEIVMESEECNYLGTVFRQNGVKYYCVSRKIGGLTEAAFDGTLETLFLLLVKDSALFDECKTQQEKDDMIEYLNKLVDSHIHPYLVVTPEFRIRRREEVDAVYHALELRIQKIQGNNN